MTQSKQINCNLCGSDDHKFLYNARDRLYGFEGQFSYVRCSRCGLVFINPQITSEQVKNFYPDDYAPHADIKRVNRESDFMIPEKISDNLPENFRVLDIGCGRGDFLHSARSKYQCSVYGIDISRNAADSAKSIYGLDVFCGTVFDCPYEDNYFDLITAWSLIEHLNDPDKVLKRTHRLLKRGGYLIIKTPNAGSFNALVFRDKWYHLDCPRHLYLFSNATLRKILEKNGFEPFLTQYKGTAKGILYSLQNCFFGNNHDTENKFNIRRSKIIKNIVSPIARFSSLIKKSDIITVCAKKRSES